jgi:hypothetical protein
MATDSHQAADISVSFPPLIAPTNDSPNVLPAAPEVELDFVVAMEPSRCRVGIGKVVSRAKATPEPIIDFDSE